MKHGDILQGLVELDEALSTSNDTLKVDGYLRAEFEADICDTNSIGGSAESRSPKAMVGNPFVPVACSACLSVSISGNVIG